MTSLAVFIAFAVLCCGVQAQTDSITSEDILRSNFDNITDNESTLQILANFSVSNQLSYLNLTGTITLLSVSSYTITSQVFIGPMFVLGGIDLNLNLNVNLNDSSGQGLISFSGNQLTINNGSYSGHSYSSYNYLFTVSNTTVNINSGKFTASRILNVSSETLNITGGTFAGIDSKQALKIKSGTASTIGNRASCILNMNNGTLYIIEGTFIGSDIDYVMMTTSDTEIIIGSNNSNNSPTFKGIKILEVSNTNPNTTFTILQSTFQSTTKSESNGVQIVINNATSTFGTNSYFPIFIDLKLLQISGGSLNIVGGNISGLKHSGLQIIISESANVTIGEQNTTNATFSNFNTINVDNSQLNIFSGEISTLDLYDILITSSNSIVTIGDPSSQTQTLILKASKILNMINGTLNIIEGTFIGSDIDYVMMTTSDTEIIIGSNNSNNSPTFKGIKILEVSNTNPNTTFTILQSTFQSSVNSFFEEIGVQLIINNATSVIGTNESYPTFTDLELLQFSGGTSSVDYGQITGNRGMSCYLKATNSSVVTIGADISNPSFRYIDFQAVGGHIIFKGGDVSKEFMFGFRILSEESGIITIENSISDPTFTYFDIIFCEGNSTLNIFAGFTCVPDGHFSHHIVTINSTVVIGRNSSNNELNIKSRLFLKMDSGVLNIVSGNIIGTNNDFELIRTSDTLINIVEGSTATINGSKVFEITEGIVNIQGGIFIGSNVFNITKGTLNIQGGTFIQNSIKHAVITTSEAVVTFGENSTSIFVSAWALDIIQSNLSIFGGNFTGINSKQALISTSNTSLIIGSEASFDTSQILDTNKGQLNITGGLFTGSSQGTMIKTSDTEIIIGSNNSSNSPTFKGIKILEVSNTNPNTTFTILQSTFQSTTKSDSNGVQIIINNAATVIGKNESYPTFIDLELLQFSGGSSNIDCGYFTGIQRESVYGQIKATDPSEVTISEDNENRSFLYVDFNSVGGHMIFKGGNLSRDETRKFFILASESGIITIENIISNPTFTNIESIICNDKSTLNIFTGFTYSPENTSKALIQTNNSTVVIGRVSQQQNYTFRRILNMTYGALHIVSGNLIGIDPNTTLIATYGTHIIIREGSTANFTTSRIFDITEGTMNILGGIFTGSNVLNITKGTLNIYGGT
ncbi:MAG: hypothetical protein EZS28_001633, partial [Streblomastix strix]